MNKFILKRIIEESEGMFFKFLQYCENFQGRNRVRYSKIILHKSIRRVWNVDIETASVFDT